MGVCTFCGHGHIYGEYEAAKEKCFTAVENLIKSGTIDCFLIGNYGGFDNLAASVCLALKKQYPHISVNLVLPYYRPHLDEYDKERYARFDSVITPELEETPHRFRITKANEYMVDQADTVIAYVRYDGGAAKTLSYAKRRKKQIIKLCEVDNYGCN